MTFNARTVFTWLIGLGMLGAAAFLPAIYNIGLLVRPSAPVAAVVHAPPLLRAAIWAHAEGRGEPRLVAITPWSLFSVATCHAYVEGTEPRERRQAAHDECFDRQAGAMLAGQLSRAHTDRELRHSPRWAISQVATMAELTRNWTIDQVIDTLAAEGPFGHNWTGADQASQGCFGKPAASLTSAEAALLVLQLPDEGWHRYDPWKFPDQTTRHRNDLLQRMHRNGALDDGALGVAIAAPLGVKTPPPAEQ